MLNGLPPMPQSPLEWYLLALAALGPLSGLVIFTAILINFVEAHYAGRVARVRRSPVATFSMILFFVGLYLLIHQRIGVMHLASPALQLSLMTLGGLLFVLGTAVNVLGRLRLGHNWANQATIYTDHTLVTTGVYGIVRHPLYASLIWIFFAAGLVYQNYAALLATAFVFLPAMTYRAHLEEALLVQQFPGYAAYQRRVGMFFPKLIRRSSPDEKL